MFTSESAKAARSKVSSESCRQNGKKGYQSLVNQGKERLAARKAAEWRISHPSNLERKVIEWLDEMDIWYQREVELDVFFADFVVGKIVIEVNGAQWHELEDLRSGQKAIDKRKYQTLGELGYTVVILSEKDVISGEAKNILERIFK